MACAAPTASSSSRPSARVSEPMIRRRSPMCSAHAHRLLGLLLGFAVGCSHQTNATGEGRADDKPVDIAHHASLTSINPRDIASIEVLQDPAGTAMYGVRGANGVIVIRTKRPGQ